ncbi:MAG: hypothetical protein HFI09_02175, partial [Bacilli bacterium]|nr:hypothetical protein [Bacilli bacterium]
TEWGAVAYLQHSKYGSATSVRINNYGYTTGYGAIREPIHGYSASDTPTASNGLYIDYGTTDNVTRPYNTEVGYLASTTGNISGIYDMSGGSDELVMGVMVDQNGKPMSGENSKRNSGFNGLFGCYNCYGDTSGLTELTTGIDFPESKYYDQYRYSENEGIYSKRILGDATGEMGPFETAHFGQEPRNIGSWYSDEAWMVAKMWPWFQRGANFPIGIGAGIFMFGHANGVNAISSFRVVLST